MRRETDVDDDVGMIRSRLRTQRLKVSCPFSFSLLCIMTDVMKTDVAVTSDKRGRMMRARSLRSMFPWCTQAEQVDGEHTLPLQDSQPLLPPSPPGEVPTLINMVANAVHIIYEMSRRQEVPTEVHSRILSTLRPSLGGTTPTTAVAGRPGSMWVASSSTTWSASMWIKMLEAGHARSKETTILNMIEWIGASEWYDAELEQAEKAPPLTKRKTPRRRVATVVLDKYLREVRDDREPGRRHRT